MINAILSAETDTAQGGCTAGSGADEILIGSANYVLPVNTALPIITTSIRITGESATITTRDDTASSSRATLLQVGPTGNLSGGGFTLDKGRATGLIIDGGTADLHDVTVTRQQIGGISVQNGGILKLKDSVVSYNLGNGYVTIGGIELYNGSKLFLYNSIVRDNDGGIGVGFRGGPRIASIIHIEDSRIINNAGRYRSGIDASGSNLTLLNSVISGNGSQYGPAIKTGSYPALISNCIISSSHTTFGDAAGIHAGEQTRIEDSTIQKNKCGDCKAGGIYAVEGAEITNTAVLGNRGVFAGGIVTEGQVTIRNSTIAGNTVKPHVPDNDRRYRLSGGLASQADPNAYDQPIVLQNTIIADNTGGHWQCAEDLLDESTNNFTSDGSCEARYAGSASPFDLSTIDKETARYWPVRANHIAAIGGDVSTCTKTDMLGTNRLEDGVCSLGSVEYTRPDTSPPPNNPGNGGNHSDNNSSGSTAGTGSTGVLGDSDDKSAASQKGGGPFSLQLLALLLLLQLRFRKSEFKKTVSSPPYTEHPSRGLGANRSFSAHRIRDTH